MYRVCAARATHSHSSRRAPQPLRTARARRMHSLYWRIFLAFWAALALILVGTVTVAVNATAHRSERPWVQRGQLYAQAARAFESGGAPALKSWLQSLGGEPFTRTFVVDPQGHEILGRPLPASLNGLGGSPGSTARAAN